MWIFENTTKLKYPLIFTYLYVYEKTKFPNCNVLLRNFRCILQVSEKVASKILHVLM